MWRKCGGQASSEPLSFWNFYGPGGQVKAQSQWFVDATSAWNKQNRTQIKLQYIPTTDYVGGSKLQTAFASGSGPDIFLISPGDFLRYYNGGVLYDLTPYIASDAQSDLVAGVMGTRMVNGKIYGIPMEVEPMAFYYSIDAFEKAGLSESDIPKTWDQLLEVGAKLKTNKRYGILFETAPGYYQNFTWYPFMWQGKADAVDLATKKSSFNSPGTIQALKLWQDAVKQGISPRTTLGTGGGDLVGNLAAGYCAIQNVGIWGIADLKANAPHFKYGVFKLPIPAGGTYTTVAGGWAFVVNAKGKNPQEAAKFCAWALASTKTDSIQRGVDWISKVKSDVAPRKSVMDLATQNGAFSSGPMKVFKDDVFPGARGEPRYPAQVYKAISDAIQSCMLNGADPRQAAETASKTIDSFLSGYNGAAIL
ncbi:ABC transporter substrate-binding protein [Dictyobacter formicarum]|uniref:Sugar ABC transporter substrate-binding protein n=1 Tax=Dictyobacter formicarum TaxID=2778368 RepID=A0ABQ3VSZ3_9CHLR|nr:sugar ABC transporter substrate-binding protein [Dictyobacter formicarum]GHO88851.1 sugar ABC transporter substrate-binding protein [Dictyobacter formicarum]